MKKRAVAILTVLTVLAVLALPAVAAAGLPKTTDTLIVPAHSLGGVTLGSNAKQVMAAWGKTANCETQCVYDGKNSGELGSVLLQTSNEGATFQVENVYITVAEITKGSKTEPDFETPLTRFKTAKGIGLGSTKAELKRAYPAAKREGVPIGGILTFILAGPKESRTTFTVGATGQVITIAVALHPGG
jgi:hypothetical protein